MKTLLKSFANDESGAVTVDWVVLTAAIVGIGILVMTAINSALTAKATAISGAIAGVSVGAGT